MIDVTRLYANATTLADGLRYGEPAGQGQRGGRAPPPLDYEPLLSAGRRRPVVVWNCTRTCNLTCAHCYAGAGPAKYPGELSTAEGKALIDDLAAFRSPALLFSGGEPLLREDLFELAAHAAAKGLRPVLSTNGTLIDGKTADRLKAAGFVYVGVSLDGLEETNDRFRGTPGAFRQTLAGLRALASAGQRSGLRLTLTRRTVLDLERIFELVVAEKIGRVCFYHLVYSGRGRGLAGEDLSHRQTRQAMDVILARTREIIVGGAALNVLTVGNHADGPYLYLRLLREDPPRAGEVKRLLEWNGGGAHGSGVGIGCVDSLGNVHPDQFWTDYTFGNVRQRQFSAIWTDISDPLLAGLKDRRKRLKGRCGACRFQAMCGGSLRVRAVQRFGDPWAPDPACYLSNEEIGLLLSQSLNTG